MHLRTLLKEWKDSAKFNEIKQKIEKRGSPLVYGIEGSQKAFLLAGLIDSLERPFLVVAPDQARAEKIYEDLLNFFPPERVCFFPARDFFYTEALLVQSKELVGQRIAALSMMRRCPDSIVVMSVTALQAKMVPPSVWDQVSLVLKRKERFSPEQLSERLVRQGYERVTLVEEKGQYSVRGAIIDIYPYDLENPVRIDYFDDQVESLRAFDLSSQRSLYDLDTVAIPPAQEIVLSEEARVEGKKRLLEELKKVTAEFVDQGKENIAARLKTKMESFLQTLDLNGFPPGIEHYLNFFYPEAAFLSDYLPQNGIVVFDAVQQLSTNTSSLMEELKSYQGSLLLQGDLLPSQAVVNWSLEEITGSLKHNFFAFDLFSSSDIFYHPCCRLSFSSHGTPSFRGKWGVFQDELDRRYKENYRLIFLAHSAERVEQVLVNFKDMGIQAGSYGAENLNLRCLNVASGNLENGFFLPELKVGLFTEQDFLSQGRKRKRIRKKDKREHLRSYRELVNGSYIVHEQHGIGRYMGMRTLETDGVTRDYLHIQYAGEDKMFIPVDQMDCIQKYIGAEGGAPRLHRLGGQEWNKTKRRVKASVQELAQELLSLYALRQASGGFAFSKEHPWQGEFEMRFPYEETPDQLEAIRSVKADMEKKQTMDRLLCGDVGYGKTEVGLRAAFKAVLDGKQVALLVPTTILAQQHYRNFKERFEGFPMVVEVLSRFRSAATQKQVLSALRQGKVDIIIGTHRLLSKDVRFHDLGLLIIDEEQRFGVKHKEKLKQMRLDVDILTMTATPIPRTLHLSLVGARDLSVIETPPEDRYPVQTYVVEYSENVVRDAVLRELKRNGQVYFVHNRVEDIERWALHLEKLIPQARIVVAHGQMPEKQLEEVMNSFLDGEYDLLLSTTIIEAGLDIPNVNTMIIHDADRFGLAQLYQLRGRVGRSNRVAYCYLMCNQGKVLSESARKRLQAIKEFAELGSGFKVALRDLEIRGAGSILGSEQHGFIATVGFELYCQLLEQAILKLKGKPKVKRKESKVELNVSAYIPTSYVTNQQLKIEFYQRILACEEEEDVLAVEEEIRDRFGTIPLPVANLLAVARLRVAAHKMNVVAIKQEKRYIAIRFDQKQRFSSENLWRLTQEYRGALKVKAEKGITLRLKTEGLLSEKIAGSVEKLLQSVEESLKTEADSA